VNFFKRSLIIIVSLIVASCSGTGTGNPLLGTVSGKLTTSTMAPGSGGSVNAASSAAVNVYAEDDSIVASANADSTGAYSVQVMPGDYTIEFSADGYRKRRHNISMGAKENLTFNDMLLSRPVEVVGGSVGSQILFAGADYTTGIVDGYDVTDGSHFTANLSVPRRYVASATIGNSLFFVGGYTNPGVSSVIDVYDSTMKNWSVRNLTTARQVDQVATIGTKLIVGGGFDGSGVNALTDVEIIDTSSWTTTNKTLSVGRHWAAAVSVGSKAYFIGGVHCWTLPACANNTIDIYDSGTDSISTITMPRNRTHHKATVMGTKIYIGGGDDGTNFLNIVDVLDTTNNSWTSLTLTTAPGQATIAGTVGSYVFFAGGNSLSNPYSKVISLIDTSTGIQSELNMSEGRYNIAVAIANGKAYLAGGDPAQGGNTDLIEVLDPSGPAVSIFSKDWF